ncbi:MAG: hypothetical protein ACKO5K_03025 [Armatimonadota bacterium]
MKKTATLLVAGITLATPALAAPPKGTYAAFLLGTSQNDHSDIHVQGPGTNATFHGVNWAMHPFESAPYYVAKIGTPLRQGSPWDIEVDFTHSKAIALTGQTVRASGTWKGDPLPSSLPLNTHLERVRFTNGVNILSVLPIRRFAPAEARIQPYAGVGPAYFIIWSVSVADGVRRHARYHGAGFGWTGVAGVRGRIRNGLSWVAEAKFTDGPADVPAGTDLRLTTRIRTRHETVGLLWNY